MNSPAPTLAMRCLAEMLGTFLLVFLGCGAVHVAVLTGALTGLWQVAIVWGIAIMLAGFSFGGISGAHINPAVTIALAVWGRFRTSDVVPYVAAQVGGGFLAACTLFLLFGPFLTEKEREKQVVRGHPGSEITAMCYGEYFPNPGRIAGASGAYAHDEHARLRALVSEPVACLAEFLGTLILGLAVFALTDDQNPGGPAARTAPIFIGLTVAALIAVIAPLTQACFNPARDFGPRLFASLAGWGKIALPGSSSPAGFLTVYILSPIFGAIAGGGLARYLFRPAPPAPAPEGISNP